MSWATSFYLLVTAHALVCASIGWACICRLNSDVCRRDRRPRARYSLLLAGALASGAQPVLFGSVPTAADLVFATAVLAGLLINVVRWRAQPAEEGDHDGV